MPRRGENIYKRKDGRWEGRMLKPDGKHQYFYGKTYKEVKEKKKALEQDSECFTKAKPVPLPTAVQLFDGWLKNDLPGRVKPSTYESYYRCVTNYILPYFSKGKTDGLDDLKIADFVHWISNHNNLSEAYKRKLISIFKTALKDIFKSSQEHAPSIGAIKIPGASNPSMQVFSVMEQRLVERTAAYWPQKRALGILLCLYTGIRLGELCALKWEDIDFDAGTIFISKTVSRIHNFNQSERKTSLCVGVPKSQKSIRKIPVPGFLSNLRGELKIYCTLNPSHYILTNSETPLDPRTFQKLFKKILKAAGVRDRKFHAIRHTFATHALELGVDMKTLSEILGHANVSITLNIYAHSLFEQKKIAMNKLNEMYIDQTKSNPFAV